MGTEPARRSPESTKPPSEAAQEQFVVSDGTQARVEASQADPTADIFLTYTYTTSTQGEVLEGLAGHYVGKIGNDEGTPVSEIGEVDERSGHQAAEESIPGVPSSFANLDLGRLTVWGWILLLASGIMPAAIFGALKDIVHFESNPFLGMPLLGLWGVIFIGVRAVLESRNVTIVRRKN